jgi:hypothetical protein
MVDIKDLVGFSKPTEKLIDVVAKGIGTIFEPAVIRRRATAEADAKVILAEADAMANDIAYRATERLRAREVRRQRNIEAVLRQTEKILPSEVSSDPVAEDWGVQFFDGCQDSSDDILREHWARILAGELKKPGSFSRRTLRTVKDMSKNDALNFEQLCSNLWWLHFPESKIPRIIIPNTDSPVIHKLGLNLDVIKELELSGLVHSMGSGYILLAPLQSIAVSYYSKDILLKRKKESYLRLGTVMISRAGEELLGVVTATEEEELCASVLEFWRKDGWHAYSRSSLVDSR